LREVDEIAAQPLRADSDTAKIALGAAALLGTAALVHQNQNHKNDKHHDTPEKEAARERGYQDGLHNASYHPVSAHESSCREGYDSGVHERNNRVHHNRDHEWDEDRHSAPKLAMRACVGEVSDSADLDPRDITAVRSTSGGGGNDLVEVASGYRHYTCTVDADGKVRGMRNGGIRGCALPPPRAFAETPWWEIPLPGDGA
jgi:hypothetical protein